MHDVFLREEGRLDIELRKLRLPVGAQIFVAKAARDLIVTIEARHHQQLLEDLRRLWQSKEFAGMRAARHEVIPRTLRRRLGKHRRLEIDETIVIEKLAHGPRDTVPQPQTLLHDIASQIDVAIAQPGFFAHVLVELERQRLGAVQQLELRC